MVHVAVLASGRGSNLDALLKAQAEGRLGPARVQVVVSDRKDARAMAIAFQHGIETVHVDPKGLTREAFDTRVLRELEARGIQLVVLAGYMRLLSPVLVRAYRDRIINIHPALLPSFPGLNAQRQALDWGARVTGATTHFVDEQVDHGPIILQSAIAVLPTDTEDTLADRILETEQRLLPATVRLAAEGRLSVEGRRVTIQGGYAPPTAPLLVPEVIP